MARTGYYKSTVEALSVNDGIQDYEFAILNAYPNPFNPSVTINYIINDPSNVEINIVNLEGKVVEVLESSFKSEGNHSVVWNPTDIASGVYFVNVSSENMKDSHKLMFLK